jgi:dephospho-CoA kinase
MFAAHGVRIVDTDLISHQLTKPGGEAIPAIRDAFGAHLIDPMGALNRSKMRELVFANPSEKKRLEAILHPLIFEQAQRQATSPTRAPYTLVVVPLLFESGRYAGWLHRVITVDCPENVQIARTIRRGNLAEAAVRAIMAQQLSRSERLRLADEVIHNDGDLPELQSQVDAMHHSLCGLAAETN